MIPWKLFGLTPRDMSGTLLRVWNQAAVQLQAIAQLQQKYTVPDDQAALLLNWSMLAVAGVLQQPIYAYIAASPKGTANNFWFTSSNFPQGLGNTGTSGQTSAFSLPLNGVLIPPGSDITIVTSFSGGANANQVNIGLGAILIPRGDVAYL